ncbi:Fc.00g098880.m01.CDS01 [Cosmosporella sp. VM-42]
MKFSVAAVLAAAAGVSAGAYGGNVTYTTEVVDVYTTYCPGPTEITHGGKTYTITEATTFTITDCPCTITKPVITTSAVVCHNCPAPGYTNSTLIPVVPTTVPGVATGTGSKPAPTGETPTEVPTAGAAKVAAAGLAGIVGLAAFVL